MSEELDLDKDEFDIHEAVKHFLLCRTKRISLERHAHSYLRESQVLFDIEEKLAKIKLEEFEAIRILGVISDNYQSKQRRIEYEQGV